MIKVTYIKHNGMAYEVEVPIGTTLKDAALDNGVPGIDGDCGGKCACATCHLFVDEGWWERVGGPRSQTESDLLSFADGAKTHSRLGCQVELTAEHDGLVVRLPLGQH